MFSVSAVAATANASRKIAFDARPASFRSCVVKPFAPCVAFASAGPLTSHAVVLAVLPSVVSHRLTLKADNVSARDVADVLLRGVAIP